MYNRGRLDAGTRDQPEYQQKYRTEPEKRETKIWTGTANTYLIQCLRPRSLRKEVIQPQVLLRLPCYDFTPIMNHTLGLFKLGLLVQSTFVM
jgi:hypothetical protein